MSEPSELDEVIAAIDGDAPDRARLFEAIARTDMQRYNAYRAAGFSDEQAFQFALKASKA